MANEQQGNPEIGMQADSLEAAESKQTNQAGSENFFNALEQDVNSAIQDDNLDGAPEVTQSQRGSNMATHNDDQGSDSGEWDNNSNPYEKRYRDSSREAVKLKEQLSELEPFVPVLQAMKNDSGLVEHVRGYLQNGGAPAKSVQESLGLDEDFSFDAQDAMAAPDSDSAKVMNAHVDRIVQTRVNGMMQAEKANAQKVQTKIQRKQDEEAFKADHNMTDDQFEDFVNQAKGHKMTLSDIHKVLNSDSVGANVANATRNDMLTQMKNVRNMPTSAGGVNSQGDVSNPEGDVFDIIAGDGSDIDNLFG